MELKACVQSKKWVLRTIIISNMKTTAMLLTAAATLCSATVAHALTHEYVVTVDAGMRRMQVEAKFGTQIDKIAARSRDAGSFLADVRDCSSNRDDRIRIRNRRMLLPAGGLSCLRYSVNLERAATAEQRNASLSDANIIVSPAAWFWRPELRGNDEIVVRFELPDSVSVSVPWNVVPGENDTYQFQDSPESSTAFAAFGRFQFIETDIPGATLRITLMQPRGEIQAAKFVEWVRETAENVNLAYGRFPNPSTSVVILPVGGGRSWSDSPVPFGRVVRDGGETIELFVNQSRPIDEFYDDWTATHEFSHLLLPYISSRHRWVSEGFASYYQNILLARADRYTEERAWQKLWDGFERGRQSRPEMSPNEAARGGIRAATMKIYWSGAAIAFMADVELRQRSSGAESLDTVLDSLQQCCLPSERSWSGTELFRKLDSLIDEPVFMPLYRRYANTAGFPDVRPLFDRLGVEIEDGEVHLQGRAQLATIRSAIMRKP